MLIAQLLSLSALAVALPAGQAASSTCTDQRKRLEWRQLNDGDRASFVQSVQCLTTKPSRLDLNTTLYDDFAHVHQALDKKINLVGSFLPWHRYFVHVYEKALQDCGYNGTATYWDWTLDAEDPVNSKIWDAESGLGGNGNSDKAEKHGDNTYNCVTDGPFADLKPAYHNDDEESHCLSREFNSGSEKPGDMFKEEYSKMSLKRIQGRFDYQNFRVQLEEGPHLAINTGVGGDMATPTAPNDPLFFLHHAQIDRLWWEWQQKLPSQRNKEYSGIKTQDDDSSQVSLDDTLEMLGLADDVKVKDVMTTDTDLLCYKY